VAGDQPETDVGEHIVAPDYIVVFDITSTKKENVMVEAAAKEIVTLPTVGLVEVEAVSGLTNWKTLAFNGGVVVGGALLSWLTTVDWTEYVSPNWAMLMVLGINAALRFFTKGPVGSSVVVKKL